MDQQKLREKFQQYQEFASFLLAVLRMLKIQLLVPITIVL